MANSRYLIPAPFTFTAAGQTKTNLESGRRHHHQVSLAWIGAGADIRISIQVQQYQNGPLVPVTGSPFAAAGGNRIVPFTGHYYSIVVSSSTIGAWAGTVEMHWLDYNEGDADPIAQGTLTDISET